jgi:hypothetical protein
LCQDLSNKNPSKPVGGVSEVFLKVKEADARISVVDQDISALEVCYF